MFLAVVPLVIVLQALPPPAGRLAMGALLFGVRPGQDVIVAVPGPAPPGAPPGEDCNCGVPSSPRGPR